MFEARWGVEMKRKRGLKIPEMFDAAIDGSLKAMWVSGEDIVQSDPDIEHVMEALGSLEFLVVQEIFENETSKFANVILPASSFLEKTGTFTNAERRIQLVRAAVDPPGAREDRPGDLLADLRAARLRAGLRRGPRTSWPRSPSSRPTSPASRTSGSRAAASSGRSP